MCVRGLAQGLTCSEMAPRGCDAYRASCVGVCLRLLGGQPQQQRVLAVCFDVGIRALLSLMIPPTHTMVPCFAAGTGAPGIVVMMISLLTDLALTSSSLDVSPFHP